MSLHYKIVSEYWRAKLVIFHWERWWLWHLPVFVEIIGRRTAQVKKPAITLGRGWIQLLRNVVSNTSNFEVVPKSSIVFIELIWHDVSEYFSCCSSCEEIHLEVSNPCFIQDRLPLISDCPWEDEETDNEPEESWTSLLTKLEWMESLKKFAYIVKGCPFTDLCFEGFSKWLFNQLNPKCLQVWLPSTVQAINYCPDSKISHLCLGNSYELDLNFEEMNDITHLAGILNSFGLRIFKTLTNHSNHFILIYACCRCKIFFGDSPFEQFEIRPRTLLKRWCKIAHWYWYD